VWIVQLYVRVSSVKNSLLLLKSGSEVTRMKSGVLGLTKSAIRDGVHIPIVQIEG
jgi:hypothetical protein